MHQETLRMLAERTCRWRNIYIERDAANNNPPTTEALKFLAEVENLIEDHARREWERRALVLPSRYARVHLMGHTTHVGEVEQLPGGALRINAIDSKCDRGVFRYVVDAEQRARHSVEWLTEAEWKAHVARLVRDHERSIELSKRTNVHECTGLTATWCPRHGTCTCSRDAGGERAEMDNRECPLHGLDSDHADAEIPSDATAEAPAAEQVERLDQEARREPGESDDADDLDDEGTDAVSCKLCDTQYEVVSDADHCPVCGAWPGDEEGACA